MFTGIITDIGTVIQITGTTTDKRFRIATKLAKKHLAMGASVACSGACLTVVKAGKGWFEVEASPETLQKTTTNNWRPTTKINLEPALCAGDALGGHIVSGHVDGLAKLESIQKFGNAYTLTFIAPKTLAKFIAPKGSVTLDGVSLTVNDVRGARFTVAIIPHTWKHTTFSLLKKGDQVNLEIDMLARYVARLIKQ